VWVQRDGQHEKGVEEKTRTTGRDGSIKGLNREWVSAEKKGIRVAKNGLEQKTTASPVEKGEEGFRTSQNDSRGERGTMPEIESPCGKTRLKKGYL